MFARPGLCGMGIGRLGLVVASQPSLVAQALSILAKYGAAANLYLPGVGAISGITAGNWLDSAGTTAATVDNPVGLVVSAGKAVGPELITVNSVTGLPSGGGTRYYGLTSAMPTVVVGKTYRVSYTVSGYSGSGYVGIAGTNSFSQVTHTGNGSYQSVHTPNGTVGLVLYTSDTNTCNFSNISVRELPGAHLTQSTAANRPVLRRGLVNQATYSSDFSNATWQQYKASAVGSKIVANTENSYHAIQRNYTHTAGSIQTYAIEASTAEYENLRVSDGSNAAFYASLNTRTGVTSSSGGPKLVSVSSALLPSGRAVIAITVTGIATAWHLGFIGYPASGATLTGWGVTYTGDGTSGINVHAQALFQGTVTASQILAAGGIPVTTTAPASSTNGPFAWQFDGSNDSFTSTLTTGNEGWVCAGVSSPNTNSTYFCSGSGSNAQKGIWLYRTAANNRLNFLVGDGVTVNSNGNSLTIPVNVPTVVDGGWDATTNMIAVDGVEAATPRTNGSASPSPALLRLGAYTDGVTYPLNGAMTAAVYTPVLPSAEDRKIIRQFIASLSGVTM